MSGQEQRYLVINADDYGYSTFRDAGILRCFYQGLISNVSIMVNGVAVKEGVTLAKKAGLPMGLHMNITEGSLISTKPLPTLTGEDGFMLGKKGFLKASLEGRIDLNEVRYEFQCQIDQFTELIGCKPTNVDGHQHVHVLPGVAEVFASVLEVNGIKLSRLPLEHVLPRKNILSAETVDFLKEIISYTEQAEPVFANHGVRTPCFAGLWTMGKAMSVDALKAYITAAFLNTETDGQRYPPVCELMVHPGNRTGETGGCGDGPDLFSQSVDREHEMAVLGQHELKDFFNSMNVKLISFRECKKLNIK